MPGAWYDASCRVAAALAVSRLIRDMVPCDKQNYDRANEAINLAVAVEELLTLANKDIERIETELKCPATSKD
jgi:hypothetical protein